MNIDPRPQNEELAESLHSLTQLKRSAVTSVLLMIIGVVAAGGAVLYAATRLRPLEDQVAERRAEIRDLEATAVGLADRNVALSDANEAAQEQLQRAQAEVAAILEALEAIARRVPPADRVAIQSSIARIRGIDTAISSTQDELRSVETKLPEEAPAGDLPHAVSGLFSERGVDRLKAYETIMGRHARDSQLVPQLLNFARTHKNNLNGVYNTLVVLSHLRPSVVAPHVEEVRTFAKEVEGLGPRIDDRVQKLRDRLPK